MNITVVSYVDRVGFGLIACSSNMPDLDDLAAEFPAAGGRSSLERDRG